MRFNTHLPIIIASLLIGENSLSGEKDTISLADAIANSLKKNPALATFDADRRIAEANIITARTRPNPELETEIEDVLGSGDYRGFNSAIYNIGVSQLIETGRKRQWRTEIAKAEQRTQQLQFDAVRRQVISETGKRYIDVLTAQEIEQNAGENYRIAGEAYTTITKQIEEGRGSAIDSGQALLGKNEALLSLETTKRETALARQRLSAMWAEPKPGFSVVSGKLLRPKAGIPSLDVLYRSIENHPALLLAGSGVCVAESQLTLEEKNRKPDVTVGLGYRRDSSIDDNALVLGLSLPIPIFDKNEGGIAKADAEIDRRKALVSQTQTQLEMSIAEARAKLVTAKSEYDLVSGDMLSAAQDHYNTLKEAYALGRVQYLNLLEARRASNAIRKQKLESLGKYHAARVELESLTGEKF